MFGDEFTPISYEIIQSLKSKLDAEDVYEQKVLDIDFKEGDKLTIKEGKFAGIDAIFLSKKSKDRVRLLLNLLNTKIVSEISLSDIGSKEIIKNFKF
jgi:transcription antitermination factor NusG